MPKKKSAAAWRAFLRVLARTGNARLAACQAGMDVGTAYDHRIKDAGFAARWEAALRRHSEQAAKAKARPPSRKASADKGEELVLRRTKHGDQLIRAAPGRWNAGVEKVFRATLRRTGCVRAAARACGLSTNALYYRRDTYPDFAAAWAADEAHAKETIPGLLAAATIASLDPEVEDKALPQVNVDQAIAIARLKCGPSTALATGFGKGKMRPELPIEAVRDEVIRRLAAIRRHRQKGDGA